MTGEQTGGSNRHVAQDADTGRMENLGKFIGGRKYRLTMTVEIEVPEDCEYWVTEKDLVDPYSWEHPALLSILAEITRIEAALIDGTPTQPKTPEKWAEWGEWKS